MKFHNSTIRLIPFESSHWPYVCTWANSGLYDNFFGNSGPFTTEQFANFNSSGHNFLIVNFNDFQKIIGMVCVSSIDERSRNFFYNILIDVKYQGQGHAKEASKIVLYYMFNNLNLYKAIALVSDENIASKKLTESFGFEHEAVLKQEFYFDGEFKDVNRYMMFKGSFNKIYKKNIENYQKS